MAHLHYRLDLCAEAFVVNKGSVLLRFHEKYSIWNGPGGHIDPGEDPNEAVLREVWEETGLKVKLVGPLGWSKKDTETNLDLVPPIFLNRHKINDVHDHSTLIFAAVSDSRDVQVQFEDEDAESKWVTQDELDTMLKKGELSEEVYKYASTAIGLIN